MTNELLAERFMNLFRGRETYFGKFIPNKEQGSSVKIEGRAATVQGKLSVEDFEVHLFGKPTEAVGIGIIPIMDNNRCWFGAIDLDDYATDFDALREKISITNLPLMICKSKSGGAHLYMFLAEDKKASEVQDLLRKFAAQLQISNIVGKDGRVRQIEIFPKQKYLVSKMNSGGKSMGSFINLPYYCGTRTAINLDGIEMTLEAFVQEAESKLVSTEQFNNLVRAEHTTAIDSKDENGDWYEAPICLIMILAVNGGKFPKGDRNKLLTQVAIYLKKRHGSSWTDHINYYNETYIEEPLGRKEVDAIIASFLNTDYKYSCSNPIQAAVCDRPGCKALRYGIDDNNMELEFGDMVVYNCEPKLYLWTINGTEVPFTSEELMNLRVIRIKILEFTGIVLGKDDMDDKKMTQLLKLAMANKKVSEVEWSLTPKGMMFSNLVSFLAQHQLEKYDSQEELWQAISKGQTYLNKEEGRWYFKLDAFNKHLIAMEQKNYKPAELSRILRSHVDATSKVKKMPRSTFTFKYWELDADKLEYYGIKKCNEGADDE